MHNPDANPMIKLARAAGLDIVTAPSGQKIRIGRRNARAGETEDFLATLVKANRALDDASRRGDMSCAAALPKELGDWAGAVDFMLGAGFSGKDLKDLSVVDKVRAGDHNLVFACRQGLGTLSLLFGSELGSKTRLFFLLDPMLRLSQLFVFVLELFVLVMELVVLVLELFVFVLELFVFVLELFVFVLELLK